VASADDIEQLRRGGAAATDPELTTATAEMGGAAPASVDDRLLEPGARVGRYWVIDHIGSGGMGAVYRAFDPDLNRQVALKILRMRAVPSRDESADRARLLREAQALAQVSHPNVIAVHDVGVVEGSVFIAMELVPGVSLRSWLKDGDRDRDDVLGVLLQAGDGLAAAHASGLVHRDFKPDNVIVGDDGRVRVIDFGLARAAESDEDDQSEDGDRESGDGPDAVPRELLSQTGTLSTTSDMLGESMTRTGALLGTPRYMAPEQFLRATTDAKADQFAFCVAAYDAICKTRPFIGGEFEDLRANVLTGQIQPPRPEANAPKHLVRALARGLATSPAKRYPSMNELLAELRRDPWRWWRRGGLAAALAAVVAVTAVTTRAGTAGPTCENSAAKLAGVWDLTRRAAVQKSFETSPHPGAARAWERTAPILDRFASEWSETDQASCRATLIRGEQSELLFERRARCLRRHRQQVAGFVALLESDLDADLVDKAAEAAGKIADLKECADDERLLDEAPLPDEPAARARVEAGLEAVDRALMLERAGRYKESYASLETLEKDTRDIDYAPLRARVMFKFGMLTDKSGDAAAAEPMYYETISVAGKARDSLMGAQAWNELLWVVGYRLGRYKEALSLVPAAAYAIGFAGNDERLVAQHLSYLGVLQYGVGKYEESLASFEESVALWEKSGKAHVQDLAKELGNLGIALAANDRGEEAIAANERSLELFEKSLGRGHPMTKEPLSNLADARAARGEFDRALALHAEVLDMLVERLGDRHPEVANIHRRIGETYLRMEEYGKAAASLAKALGLIEERFGVDHQQTVASMASLGRAYSASGRFDEAEPLLERSERATRTALGDGHPTLVPILSAQGENEFRRGAYARARARFEAARQVAVDHHGIGHPAVATLDVSLTRADVRLGAARAALARAVTAHEALTARAQDKPGFESATSAAWAAFALAEARWAANADRAAALELARRAAPVLDRPGTRERFAAVTAWLAETTGARDRN